MEKIALIADIHGNIPALEAVLEDIGKRRIKRIFCLGDLVGKGPHSDKSVDICREVCESTVLGNWDRAITRKHNFHVFLWHQQRLGEDRLRYLAGLPNTIDFHISGRKVRLFHASQVGVDYRVHAWDPEEKHVAMFTNTKFTGNTFTPDTVGYGDIHMVYLKNLNGKMLFNVGSVGNALDEPTAAYTIMEGDYRKQGEGIFLSQHDTPAIRYRTSDRTSQSGGDARPGTVCKRVADSRIQGASEMGAAITRQEIV